MNTAYEFFFQPKNTISDETEVFSGLFVVYRDDERIVILVNFGHFIGFHVFRGEGSDS